MDKNRKYDKSAGVEYDFDAYKEIKSLPDDVIAYLPKFNALMYFADKSGRDRIQRIRTHPFKEKIELMQKHFDQLTRIFVTFGRFFLLTNRELETSAELVYKFGNWFVRCEVTNTLTYRLHFISPYDPKKEWRKVCDIPDYLDNTVRNYNKERAAAWQVLYKGAATQFNQRRIEARRNLGLEPSKEEAKKQRQANRLAIKTNTLMDTAMSAKTLQDHLSFLQNTIQKDGLESLSREDLWSIKQECHKLQNRCVDLVELKNREANQKNRKK